MNRFIITIIIQLIAVPIFGQQNITLQECYDMVIANYPIARQAQLFNSQNELDSAIIFNTKLPQLSLDAQATYQSDVIEIPIPNSTIEPLSNDQYRATLSVNQLIYNGGATKAFLNLKSTQLKAKQKQVEVHLYQLKQKINQLYFSILLSQKTELLLRAKEEQLQVKLKEVSSGITYGMILPASDKVLKAELLKLNQQLVEVQSNRIVLIETLSEFINQQLNETTLFVNPVVKTRLDSDLKRPELELFLLKKEEIESSKILIAKQNAPRLLGFATGGYGNPGLNMLDNSFQPFYIAGVKLNWNVFDWNSNKKKRESLSIHKDVIDTEKETFILNTNIALNQQKKEIDKIEVFIVSDLQIINFRKEVLKSADSQLKNGVITSSAYITELTHLYEDENTLIRHKIKLQLAMANYNVIKGQ